MVREIKKIYLSKKSFFPKVSPEGNIEHPFLTQIMTIFLGGEGVKTLFSPTVMKYLFIYSPNCCTKQINPMIREIRRIIAIFI